MKDSAPLILAVDDDIDALNWTAFVLEEEGYRTHCCGAPEEAIEFMARELPALVVTDLMMDSLHSGFTFAQQLRGEPRYAALPIVVVTAAASQKGFDFLPRTQADLDAMQVQALFSKPVDPDVLLEKIRLLLAQAGTDDHEERE